MDYPQIVKNPMDLGKVQRRLANDSKEPYLTVREVVSDVDLVWYNCFLYNKAGPAGGQVRRSGERMYKKWNAALNKLIAQNAKDVAKQLSRKPSPAVAAATPTTQPTPLHLSAPASGAVSKATPPKPAKTGSADSGGSGGGGAPDIFSKHKTEIACLTAIITHLLSIPKFAAAYGSGLTAIKAKITAGTYARAVKEDGPGTGRAGKEGFKLFAADMKQVTAQMPDNAAPIQTRNELDSAFTALLTQLQGLKKDGSATSAAPAAKPKPAGGGGGGAAATDPAGPADVKLATELIQKLKKNPDIHWFLEPVDPIKLGAADYFSVVEHPMDISTVEAKLAANKYVSDSKFKHDARSNACSTALHSLHCTCLVWWHFDLLLWFMCVVLWCGVVQLDLIWYNCRLYNGDTIISDQADALKTKCDKLYAAYLTAKAKKFKASAPAAAPAPAPAPTPSAPATTTPPPPAKKLKPNPPVPAATATPAAATATPAKPTPAPAPKPTPPAPAAKPVAPAPTKPSSESRPVPTPITIPAATAAAAAAQTGPTPMDEVIDITAPPTPIAPKSSVATPAAPGDGSVVLTTPKSVPKFSIKFAGAGAAPPVKKETATATAAASADADSKQPKKRKRIEEPPATPTAPAPATATAAKPESATPTPVKPAIKLTVVDSSSSKSSKSNAAALPMPAAAADLPMPEPMDFGNLPLPDLPAPKPMVVAPPASKAAAVNTKTKMPTVAEARAAELAKAKASLAAKTAALAAANERANAALATATAMAAADRPDSPVETREQKPLSRRERTTVVSRARALSANINLEQKLQVQRLTAAMTDSTTASDSSNAVDSGGDVSMSVAPPAPYQKPSQPLVSVWRSNSGARKPAAVQSIPIGFSTASVTDNQSDPRPPQTGTGTGTGTGHVTPPPPVPSDLAILEDIRRTETASVAFPIRAVPVVATALESLYLTNGFARATHGFGVMTKSPPPLVSRVTRHALMLPANSGSEWQSAAADMEHIGLMLAAPSGSVDSTGSADSKSSDKPVAGGVTTVNARLEVGPIAVSRYEMLRTLEPALARWRALNVAAAGDAISIGSTGSIQPFAVTNAEVDPMSDAGALDDWDRFLMPEAATGSLPQSVTVTATDLSRAAAANRESWCWHPAGFFIARLRQTTVAPVIGYEIVSVSGAIQIRL